MGYSRIGWAAGTIATKYFQRDKHLDMLNFIGWQMIVGVLPFFLLPFIRDTPPVDWSPVYVAMLAYSGAIATGFGFVLWIAVLRFLPALNLPDDALQEQRHHDDLQQQG